MLGIALPDMVKNHNRLWNIHPHKHRERWTGNGILNSIEKGWIRHLQVDRLFHNSLFFNKKVEELKVHMRPVFEGNTIIRTSVLAHITLELMLDALLIRQSKIDAQHFYDHLGAVDEFEIVQFLSCNNIADPDSFLTFYDRFKTAQYLFSYRDNENIVYALNRLCLRIWNTRLTDEEYNMLSARLSLHFNELSKDYLFIFEQISAEL